MKIVLAKSSGFCFGVRNAYNEIKRHHKKYSKPVRILGDLVHNSSVIAEIEGWGIKKNPDWTTIKKGTLIIPAHGCSPALLRELKAKGLAVVNTTCPKVAKVIAEARLAKFKKRTVLILGDKKHTEVQAINGAADNQGVVFSNFKEYKKAIKNHQGKRLTFISQTTQDVSLFRKIAKDLAKKGDVRIVDTICRATYDRQAEVTRLAKRMDTMIIAGSPTSANSKRLYEISHTLNPRTHFIDTEEDLCKKWLKRDDTVGVATGASTPAGVINKIIETLTSYFPK